MDEIPFRSLSQLELHAVSVLQRMIAFCNYIVCTYNHVLFANDK